jgi:hypothetical protein
MRKLVLIYILLLVPFFNSYAEEALIPYSEGEKTSKIKPVFDEREWKLGWSDTSRPGTVFEEYVLNNEAVENWSELVTIQFFPGLNEMTNLDVFEGASKQGLVRVCPNIKWNSVYNTESERAWSWTSSGCQGQPDQSEIVRALKTKKGIYLFHYAIKKSPIPIDLEKKWIEILKRVVVTE